MKTSFDYDETLDLPKVQEYAKTLTERGIEPWIVTSRARENKLNPSWNNDLYETASLIGIPPSRP